ncbi:MAG: sugar phosphate isomerase/epimerase [Chitinophagia bacterium]|mgnify:CR=1 FL=1|jgi:inosose dehydratase|nr:sugar phosphate isomerase/epimerase [Chitinophagia bacterium]
MSNRRNFIQQTLLGATGAALLPLVGHASATVKPMTESKHPLTVGIAGYTFKSFSINQTIAMMKRIGVSNLSLKDIHLPVNSTDAQINDALAKFKAGGINVYTVGVIYMKTKEAVDAAFAYTKKVGVPMMVGVPNYELIEYAEQKVKEYDIKLAIHNHGPEDALYPAPGDVYDRIKNLDARMGMCIDIGHSLRAGTLPEKAIKMYKDRLFDIHIKDINTSAREGKGIEFGRGVIHFDEVIESLRKVKYTGVCSIEFEKDMDDPLPGIAESVGYFKGVMNTLD